VDTVTDTLRAGEPCVAGDSMLLPIEHVRITADRSNTGYRLTASKEPYAVIVRDANGLHAFTREAMAISVDALKQQIDNLDELLKQLSPQPGL